MTAGNPNFQSARRTADREIYANESGYAEPKSYFKLIGQELLGESKRIASITDVGCANGALLHHLRSVFPAARLTGIDPVTELLDVARRMQPGTPFFASDVLEPDLERETGRSDAVIMAGVLGIFFDPRLVLERLIALTQPPGIIFIFGPFNEDPIDVQLQYRRAPDGTWETGHNLYSMTTMAGLAEEFDFVHRWVDFRMPFEIAKGEDSMRSWTEPFRDNPHHLFYGTGMHCTMKLLVLKPSGTKEVGESRGS